MSDLPLVLVIDDDSWMRDQIVAVLRRAGYATSTAASAVDAIEEIDHLMPAAIVLDIFLPGANGLVLLHELQTHDDLAEIPVVLCTNNARDISPEDVRAYGVGRILDKTTMMPDDIVAAIKWVLP